MSDNDLTPGPSPMRRGEEELSKEDYRDMIKMLVKSLREERIVKGNPARYREEQLRINKVRLNIIIIAIEKIWRMRHGQR